MKIRLETIVNIPFAKVAGNFDRRLFEYLLPPKAVARLVRYDGSRPGNLVHIRFGLPYGADWISEIAGRNENDTLLEFVDVGKVLPFGLKKWRHQHLVMKIDDKTTRIVDDMQFSTCCKLFDWLVYPVLFLAFYPRKKQYKLYYHQK